MGREKVGENNKNNGDKNIKIRAKNHLLHLEQYPPLVPGAPLRRQDRVLEA